MNEREILQHRMATLDSLLAVPAPLIGSAGGSLNAQLAERWRAERRLLDRLLLESPDGGVAATVDLWQTRTERFIASSSDSIPGWTDSQGNAWNAQLVRELLDEVRDRLERWRDGPGLERSEEAAG
jgi:hypothetical protein